MWQTVLEIRCKNTGNQTSTAESTPQSCAWKFMPQSDSLAFSSGMLLSISQLSSAGRPPGLPWPSPLGPNAGAKATDVRVGPPQGVLPSLKLLSFSRDVRQARGSSLSSGRARPVGCSSQRPARCKARPTSRRTAKHLSSACLRRVSCSVGLPTLLDCHRVDANKEDCIKTSGGESPGLRQLQSVTRRG